MVGEVVMLQGDGDLFTISQEKNTVMALNAQRHTLYQDLMQISTLPSSYWDQPDNAKVH